MENSKMYDDIVDCMLYPKKIPAAMLFCDVSQGEYMLMGAFLNYEKEHGGRHITVNELAGVLGVTMPSVSRMLKNLESRGLVVRETDKDCRRNTLVYISDKGLRLFCENEKIVRQCAKKIAQVFSRSEIEKLLEYRRRIEKVLEEEIENIEISRKDKQL